MQKCQQISCRNINGKLLLDFLSVFFQDVAAQFDNYRQLMKYFAGTTIYIPKLSEIERIRRNEKIRTEYKSGNSMKVLAIKYDLTEVQIRNIVFDLYRSKKSAPVEGQLSMDDYLNEDNQNKEENR